MAEQTPKQKALRRINNAIQKDTDELDLSDLGLRTIPDEIYKLANLKKLTVSGNELNEIPQEIFKFHNLEILNLAFNKLRKVPSGLQGLRNLDELYLYGNLLTTIDYGDIANLEKLKVLHLGSNPIILKELENEINKLKNLEALFLWDIGLDFFPDRITELINLKILVLNNNNIQSLSPKIGNLKNLHTFLVGKNRLIEVPKEIGLLTSLQILDLSHNNLTGLPKEIGSLKNLERLFINANEIAELPSEIGKLQNLEWLFAGNRAGIRKGKKLSFIEDEENEDKKGNRLLSLPKEIVSLKKLRGIDLSGNDIAIPPELLQLGKPQEIFKHYFSQSVKTKSLNQAKMIFLGQGAVGKTSLVQQILHGMFDPNQTKTEGISIHQWQVDGKEKRKSKGKSKSEESKIKLNIWDFGGQEIMHATHQFFLTKRSLYLLVIDARAGKHESNIEYWLKIIQSFGGESPVLIVGNKTDQHLLDIDRTGLGKKYPNIVGILETSAATGAGIETLKAEIAKQVDSLPHVRDLLPETWFTVKSKLEELGRDQNFITQDEYLNLCGANNVSDETSQHTLIGFLHDLGVVLHFQDDPRLEALGILNPQWVTNGVYKILNSHELFQNRGTLTLPMLNKILDLPEYPRNKRLFIVDMMKKFELCYDIEPDKSFLIPDLLPKDEPYTGDQEWNGALAFQYHYNVLPSSIITRFIVRMNAFVHKTVWRSGVVLKSGGNTALVKADTEDRKITIWVIGDENTRRDFLSAIRMEFAAIHKTIAKIEATEKVPLPSQPGVAPVDYEFLLRLERDNRPTFPVQAGNDIIDVNVKELLDGVRPSKNQAVKVFISYAHKDKTFAKKLAGELEGQGMKVWWDFEGLKGGQDWQKEIERGIKGCDFFLVALTPDAVASEWVGNEITYATLAQKTIIPLHLKKCKIPIGLIKKQYIDFEKQTQKAAIRELIEILNAKELS
jgi:internalin A